MVQARERRSLLWFAYSLKTGSILAQQKLAIMLRFVSPKEDHTLLPKKDLILFWVSLVSTLSDTARCFYSSKALVCPLENGILTDLTFILQSYYYMRQ